ncbi:MAG: hypothetical protein WKG07_03115 [Hymenobacter sp.]
MSAGRLLLAFDKSALRRFDAPTGMLADVLPTAAIGTTVTDAVREADGTYYVASYDRGLLRFAPGTTTAPEVIRPNGPETASAYSLLASASLNAVDVFSGAYRDNGVQATSTDKNEVDNGFYEYKDRQWTNYTPRAYPSPTDYLNLRDLSHGIPHARWHALPGQLRQWPARMEGGRAVSAIHLQYAGVALAQQLAHYGPELSQFCARHRRGYRPQRALRVGGEPPSAVRRAGVVSLPARQFYLDGRAG